MPNSKTANYDPGDYKGYDPGETKEADMWGPPGQTKGEYLFPMPLYGASHPLVRQRLFDLGMSHAGVDALIWGGAIIDQNDRAIVARIVAGALQ